MATLTTAHLSIAVYRGEPIDSQEFRHTALFFRFQDRSPTLLAHIRGPSGEFVFESQKGYDPSTSKTLAKMVDVGFLEIQTSSNQLIPTLRSVPIQNNDREINCQTWVENVLKYLKIRQLLTDKNYDDGVEGMVDAIAEAEDNE